MPRSKIFKDAVKKLTGIFISVFFPLKCLACGRFVKRDEHVEDRSVDGFKSSQEPGSLKSLFYKEMRPYLCPWCMEKFLPLTSPICICCGRSFNSSEGVDRVCRQCFENPNPYIGKMRSAGIYDSVFRELVRSLKYNGKIQLAQPFGRLLQWVYAGHWTLGEIDMIVPVPLHVKRARARGFNQSWLMVKNWSANTATETKALSIEPDIMIRKKLTRPQTGLSGSQRKENIKGAFEIVLPEIVETKNILLIDDVFTTGSTLNECARALLKAGAQSVDALTLARAV